MSGMSESKPALRPSREPTDEFVTDHYLSEEIAMETAWIVEQVTEKPGLVEARLQRVEWFKKNPAHAAALAKDAYELPDEFIDAAPGDDGAETIEVGGTLTLDITEGPELHPMDAVVMTLSVVTLVEADA